MTTFTVPRTERPISETMFADLGIPLVTFTALPGGGQQVDVPSTITASAVSACRVRLMTSTLAREELLGAAGITLTSTGMVIDSSSTTFTVGAVTYVTIGVQQYGDIGFTLRRDDGTPAIVVKRLFGPGDSRQSLRLLDPSGATIGGDSIVAMSGFDAPHMEIPFTPSDVTLSTYARTTSSTTFVPLFEHYGYRQNPGLRLKVKAWCSDATTTADIQVWDAIGGGYLTEFSLGPISKISVPLATTVPTVFTTGNAMILPGAMSNDMQLEIHVKRTAGAGSVSLAVLRSIGRGV